MSASLVGSEMCIRDSPPAVEQRLRIAVGRECALHAGRSPQALGCGLQLVCLLYTSDAADDM
eukprot:4487037-Alexandrium_andersonii.AAC.1